MLSRALVVAAFICEACWISNALLAQPNPGRLKSEVVTPVTVDQQGELVVGGDQTLIVDDQKPEACLIRVRLKQGEKMTYPYLVYSLKEEQAPKLLLKETLNQKDPDVGFYWKKRDEIKEVDRDGQTLRYTSTFSPTQGPHSNHVLASDKDKKLILQNKKSEGESGGFVGVIRGYDNLNEGK